MSNICNFGEPCRVRTFRTTSTEFGDLEAQRFVQLQELQVWLALESLDDLGEGATDARDRYPLDLEVAFECLANLTQGHALDGPSVGIILWDPTRGDHQAATKDLCDDAGVHQLCTVRKADSQGAFGGKLAGGGLGFVVVALDKTTQNVLAPVRRHLYAKGTQYGVAQVRIS
ncbi:hypothetical protein PG990_010495 [Apiospora arundinis]